MGHQRPRSRRSQLILRLDYIGEPVYDNGFQLSEDCQEYIDTVCTDLKDSNEKYAKALSKIGFDENGFVDVRCFTDDLKNSPYGWPISEADMSPALDLFLQSETEDGDRVSDFYENNIGYDVEDETLKFIGISIVTSMLVYSDYPAADIEEYMDAFQWLVDDINADAPSECNNAMQTDLDLKYVNMNSQLVFYRSAFEGMMIGVAIAFVAISLSTWNILIAFWAVISICFTISSILAILVFLGYQIGSTESIIISITAGFAVDYVVHLAHAMVEKSHAPLEDQVREAFKDMGVSVFSGMFTSVAASFFLFFCQIQFFFKFGAFLCCTVVFSYTFSTTLFPALCLTFGTHLPFGKSSSEPVQVAEVIGEEASEAPQSKF